MRADESIKPNPMFKSSDIIDVDYINQLRVDRLMAKAEYMKYVPFLNMSNKTIYNKECLTIHNQCNRIAEALEARAKKIKEGM